MDPDSNQNQNQSQEQEPTLDPGTARRLLLDKELREVLHEAVGYVHLYFQPPASVRMEYDAIRYERTSLDVRYADNKSYRVTDEYQVIVITRDPDSPIPRMLQEHFSMIRPGRQYPADNLYHFPFTLYW